MANQQIRFSAEWGKVRDLVFQVLDLDLIEQLKNEPNRVLREIQTIIRDIVNSGNAYITADESSVLAGMICDEIIGYGPIDSLMKDETVNDILVNGPYSIYVERGGILAKTDKFFINERQLLDIARRLVNKVGKNIDEAHPLVDSRMPDGSRLNVVIPPVAIDGTSMSIRKFGTGRRTFHDLINYGSLNEDMANFLVIAARCRMNIIVSGGTGSGKTTMLNALSGFIGEHERTITLEDAAELKLQQDHVLRMETKSGGEDGRGRVTMQNLLVNALRMRPDRIILGECRGEEAFEMLQAMNTGHNGSMSTLHANTARDALSRLESMIIMAQPELPIVAIRHYIASSVNFIIQASRLPDGQRKVMSITEVMGLESDNIVTHDVFKFKIHDERDDNGKIQGEFVCNGLVRRSALYDSAQYYEMSDVLEKLMLNAAGVKT
ncbi:MAG: CpaF family protein [Gilliamella sp.]|uniref:CpaF family protein n=1 Tax=unclassified Gilliamella TaxID=2685620 RepID=UPI000461CC87|nr:MULTISPECIES: CpaF family protein [Gilliamella]KDN09830.1 Type II/IV secretion system ATP hydrolase TadA/VirB11/CpaF, TadA subfamily [Gilliamella apicola]MCO6538301.1 CpaF family protein [Gilliamella sp.]MCO6540482.1 CpaF family protein [Gilliamella sp.]